MRRVSVFVSAVFAIGMTVILSPLSGCSGTTGNTFGNDGGGGSTGNNGSGGNGGSSGFHLSGGSSGSGGGSSGAGGSAGAHGGCPAGAMCDVSCPGGGTTTVTGTVYDPGFRDPLYNIAVYVPASPLTPLPAGVPQGADACSCGALFKSGAVVNATTAVDGTFTLKNVPVGSNIPLVIQVGKWRRQYNIDVKACTDNAQPDKSLGLPNSVPAGDTNTSMPDIAVSTGGADTLECLMTRIGLPPSEYVAGTATGGHIHVFSGGTRSGGGGYMVGEPEKNVMPGAPASDTALWASQADLMPYDIVLLSCEGGETYNANPPALEAYLNAGGRVFGSHFHYAWFSGPIDSGQSYRAPSDWGNNLATWSADGRGGDTSGDIGGTIDQTLNVGGGPFPKGIALDQWLGQPAVNALGMAPGVSATELSIYAPRYNAVVSSANTPSQPWITSATGMTGQTMYFSFDTPIGASTYCGRAVFSDLHVSGNPITKDTCNGVGTFGGGGQPPPTGCFTGDLSPQEKALEFMLFDLSSCVIPDSVAPPTDAGLPPPPK
jgi:hypothetical protein